MLNYVKLFNTILDSSIWCEADPIRILWITLMAKADADGIARGSIPGLAHQARISIEDCKAGLEKFKGPDPYSSSKEHEGRRIEEVPGGWKLLNHGKYRELYSLEARREYNKRKQSEYRARVKANDKNLVAAEILAKQRKAREKLEGDDGYVLRESPTPYGGLISPQDAPQSLQDSI